MMNFLSKFFYFFYRFFNSCYYLGFKNSFKIFILSKISKNLMFVEFFSKKFYFRPITDHGSYSRLTFKQYVVVDNEKNPIEFVIDGGANTGSQSIRFLSNFKYLRKLVCIEPDKSNYELLKKNIQYENTFLLNKALSNENDEKIYIKQTILNDANQFGKPTNRTEMFITSKTINEGNKNINSVESISINQLIKKFNFPRIDFLKIDLNGFEEELFKSNCDWLVNCNCIAFNNADLNEVAPTIIKKFSETRKIKIFNLNQMLILLDSKLNWDVKEIFHKAN